VSEAFYREYILPHDLRIARHFGALRIHPCSGLHVFRVTLKELPGVVGSEAGMMITPMAAPCVSVDEALRLIGDRPIDLHLRGFEALGAAVKVSGGNVKVLAPHLKGARISLRSNFGSTVLGTGNVMMAAVLAEGVTVIDGAAEEPEVVDLANFLIAMGAKIEGAGTRSITIEGVKELNGAEH
jgi:UDP-N-acetylglucosamine enolpyruvyl transferase